MLHNIKKPQVASAYIRLIRRHVQNYDTNLDGLHVAKEFLSEGLIEKQINLPNIVIIISKHYIRVTLYLGGYYHNKIEREDTNSYQ